MLQAAALGLIDTYTTRPVSTPDEQFHRVVTELLADWARQHRQGTRVVQIVGAHWSARSHQARDLLERYGIPFGFHDVGLQEGRMSLREVERLDGPFPVFVLLDGRVLTDTLRALPGG